MSIQGDAFNTRVTHGVPDGALAPGLPKLLDPQRVNEHLEQFRQEFEPVGPTELAIINDLARQVAAMERWSGAAEAVERHAAQLLPKLPNVEGMRLQGQEEDGVLAAAMGTEIADRCERHALGRTRAFYRALHKLEEIQDRRRTREQCRNAHPPAGFESEAACESYLRDRFLRGECPCPRCGGIRGYYLEPRKAWECAHCNVQTGLRAGTVMARSPIPLRDWFLAIQWIVWEPTMSTAKLIEKVNITRPATVSRIARKIRSAIGSENATMLLAGLDRRNNPPNGQNLLT